MTLRLYKRWDPGPKSQWIKKTSRLCSQNYPQKKGKKEAKKISYAQYPQLNVHNW